MAQQLQDMAGPNAVHARRQLRGRAAAAEVADQSRSTSRAMRSPPRTTPRAGCSSTSSRSPASVPMRGGGNIRLRDGSMSARSPFATAQRARNGSQNYGMQRRRLAAQEQELVLAVDERRHVVHHAEPIMSTCPGGHAIASCSASGSRATTSASRPVRLRHDPRSDAAVQRQPQLDPPGQPRHRRQRRDRARLSNDNTSTGVRIQEAGPLGRRFFTNTRLQIGRQHVDVHVVDRGADRQGHRRAHDRRRAGPRRPSRDDVQPAVGPRLRARHPVGANRHQPRRRVVLLGPTIDELPGHLHVRKPGRVRGRARRAATRSRIGDPNIDYRNVQAGIYIQDDIRVRKSLTLSPGMRYEAQTHLSDYNNFGPRFGDHVGAVQERARRRCAAAGASSTTG